MDLVGKKWKENDNMFIGDFVYDYVSKRKSISHFIQDITHFIHVLLVY